MLIASIGDSLAFGTGAHGPEDGQRGFVKNIAEAVPDSKFMQFARPGARLRNALSEQLGPALLVKPDILFVTGGMNDVLRGDFDKEEVQQCVDQIFAAGAAIGALVVSIRLPHLDTRYRLPTRINEIARERINEVNAAFDHAARWWGSFFLDFTDHPWMTHRSSWHIDRMHPSEAGHRALARLITPVLSQMGVVVAHEFSVKQSEHEYPVTKASNKLAMTWWVLTHVVPWVIWRSYDLFPQLIQDLWAVTRRKLGKDFSSN